MRPRKPTRAKQKRQTIDLSEREVRSLVKEASSLAAWAVLDVPASNERSYRAADKICRLTVWRDYGPPQGPPNPPRRQCVHGSFTPMRPCPACNPLRRP